MVRGKKGGRAVARVKSCLFVSIMFLFVCFAAQDDLACLWRLWQGDAVMLSDMTGERHVMLRGADSVVAVNSVGVVHVSHAGAVVLFYEEWPGAREKYQAGHRFTEIYLLV